MALLPPVPTRVIKRATRAAGNYLTTGDPMSPTVLTTTTTTPGTPATQEQGHYTFPTPEEWLNLVRGDPNYLAQIGLIRASGDEGARIRRSSVQRALIDAGFAPATFNSGFGDVDQATLTAAAQNPTSTLAGLNLARRRGVANLRAALGARGLLQSGAVASGVNRVNQNYEFALSDATKKLLDSLFGYEGAWADVVRQGNLAEAQALQQAGSRVEENYQPPWTVDVPASAGTPATTTTTSTPNYGSTGSGAGGAARQPIVYDNPYPYNPYIPNVSAPPVPVSAYSTPISPPPLALPPVGAPRRYVPQ